MKINTINLAHDWLRKGICQGDLCVDATAGRGYDTLFLCDCTGDKGQVVAFDIQEEAIKSTKALLMERKKVAQVYQASHTQMRDYIQPETVGAIIFNFGYLPGGNHTIATKSDTSIIAIEQGLSLLKKNGVMALCIYQGGDTGFEEKEGILNYLKTIDYKKFTVIVSEFYNRPNYPPLFVGIRRDQ